MVRVHRAKERIADREPDATHLEEGANIAEIDRYTLPGDRYGVRWETAVGSVDTSQQFADEFAHSEFGERRRVDPIQIFDDDRRFTASGVARPASIQTTKYVTLQRIFGRVEENPFDRYGSDRSYRKRLEVKPTALAPVSETESPVHPRPESVIYVLVAGTVAGRTILFDLLAESVSAARKRPEDRLSRVPSEIEKDWIDLGNIAGIPNIPV